MGISDKRQGYIIKLPSQPDLVTVENLWKYCEAIANTGHSFTLEQLVNTGVPHSHEMAIKRNLSYLKYLGILTEKRSKVKQNDKVKYVQKFYISEDKNVKDFIYNIKAKRYDMARENFRTLLSRHDLYLSIKNELLKNKKFATIIDLENFLREKCPKATSPTFFQKGTKFIVELLQSYGLIHVEGDTIYLEKIDRIPQKEAEKGKRMTKIPAEIVSDGDNYVITIKGPSIDTSIEIVSLAQLEIVDAILKVVREELNKKLKRQSSDEGGEN